MPGRMDRPHSRGWHSSKRDERAFEKRVALDYICSDPPKSSPEPLFFGDAKWYDPTNKRKSTYRPCLNTDPNKTCPFIQECGKEIKKKEKSKLEDE